MVNNQLKERGIEDPLVLNAMQTVPREVFVLEELKDQTYNDNPLPIGYDQTISQPYIVAFMTEALSVQAEHRVLEIGTGSGYQAAILSRICREVYTIEIIKELANHAREVFRKQLYNNIHIKVGDGHQGWPENSPFDAIIVTAAGSDVPSSLIKQLKVGGKMILPLKHNNYEQTLVLITKIDVNDNIIQKELLPVMFVPMTGNNNYRF
ncbi:MAG: protein-L-isoaspartate(D-aspartate) O-methyltransferase [Rickettsiaceae bacterium]|nr:protein-L-isoaspartate(D-aspartate) O-methyltransferase [Rickettsiaceae bacterium]